MSAVSIGRPVERVEGFDKVTGAVRYAADFNQPGQVYAVLVQSTIGLGRIVSIDSQEVERLPGVVAVLTHENAPRLPYREHHSVLDPAGERLHVLQDGRVRFFGQPVALVLAETLDEAEFAAGALAIRYEAESPLVHIDAPGAAPVAPSAGLAPNARNPADRVRGDPEAALASAEKRIDATYRMARENHNPMEPHATIAAWEGDRLTLWTKSQWVVNEAAEVAAVFGLEPEGVRVINPFVGGAFGTSLRAWPHVTLAALAARRAQRPVKLVLTRRQMFAATGYRPSTVQRIALGASRDGQLSAIVHEGTAETSRYEEYVESLTTVSTYLYACSNVRTRYRVVPLDVSTPTFMRGPGESSGIYALECAIDELAVELGIDPVELRLRNEPARDEARGLPFSSRSLRACFERGAAQFGWERRDPRPRSMRRGRLMLGCGTASATYPAGRFAASARARILLDGSAEIETAASDMGPGTYTSMTQIAADALGLPVRAVAFRLGRSDFPAAPPHGGSTTTGSVGPAVHAACVAVRQKALESALRSPASPLYGASADDVAASDGRLFLRDDAARGESYARIAGRLGAPLEAEAKSAPGEERQKFSMHAFGAIFAEVVVDPVVRTIRVSRIVGTYAAGRIINPKLARSQCTGGMIGGIGMALLERTILDPRDGRIANASLAEYLVPVNLDIGSLEVSFLDEEDPYVNPLGAKGLGEIALIGTAPAIANAVYHATGRRVRELPIRTEHLLQENA